MRTVFFEKPSLLQVLILLPEIRKAETIYFSRPASLGESSRRRLRLIRAVVRPFNRTVAFTPLTAEEILKHAWDCKEESAGRAKRLASEIERHPAYRTLHRIMPDDHLVKFFQGCLCNPIADLLLFRKMAEDLKSRHADLFAVPYHETSLVGWTLAIPRRLRFVNRLRTLAENLAKVLLFLVLPALYAFAKSFKGIRRAPHKKYKVAMSVARGFHDSDGRLNGVKQAYDDFFLYGEGLALGDIVHVFGLWPFTSAQEKAFKRILAEKKADFIDTRDFRPGWKILRAAFRAQWKAFGLLRCLGRTDRFNGEQLTAAVKGIYYYLWAHLKLDNIDFQIEFAKNDYNPRHVINTIVCNRYGKKTVGPQHCAAPFDSPQICFVHLDRYFVFGEVCVNLFKPYWNGLKIEKTGRETIDYVVAGKTPEGRTEIQKRLSRLYPESPLVLSILFPGNSERCLDVRWREMYLGLEKMRRFEGNWRIFLRFRDSQSIRKLPSLDERFVVDHENFTTPELLLLSHLVIAPAASFAVNECVAVGTRVCIFDFTNTGVRYYPDFGGDFILKTADDLVRVWRKLHQGRSLDCQWERLSTSCNYHTDGYNVHRYRQIMMSMLS